LKNQFLRRIIAISLAACLTAVCLPISVHAGNTVTAQPTASTVLINGKSVAFDAYNINGNNYFKLRNLAYTYVHAADAQPDKNISITAPTYQASGKIDDSGLSDHYIYTFADGDKDAAPGDTLLMVNGQFTNARVIIRDNRSLIPIRTATEAFGANVTWDGPTQTVKIADGTNSITMTIGKTEATVNGKTVTLEVAPIIDGDRTYVPVRFVSDYLNKSVGYLPAGSSTSSEYLIAVGDKNANKGLAYNPIVWIDGPVNTDNNKTTGETLSWLKGQMEEGLNNLKNNLGTVDDGNLKATSPNSSAFTQIENAISNAYYIGKIGRYEMFQGPYIALVDPNTDSIYFYTIAHGLGGIWKADMSDSGTFVSMYFAD